MFRFLKPSRPAVPDAAWREVRRSLPIVATLAEADAGKLRALSDSFLRAKSIEGAGGFVIDDGARAVVAAQACIPVLSLGIEAYAGWRSVIVYPGGFVSRGTSVDETGVEHEWEEERSGESWSHGPVVLSWEDVAASGLLEGYNVVIHEMAHKLDMLNGDANGFPPLHREMDGAAWYRVFSDAYADLGGARRCRRGDRNRPVRGGGAGTNSSRWRANTSSSCPACSTNATREVYAEMRAFYRQDPLERIAAARREERASRPGGARRTSPAPPPGSRAEYPLNKRGARPPRASWIDHLSWPRHAWAMCRGPCVGITDLRHGTTTGEGRS